MPKRGRPGIKVLRQIDLAEVEREMRFAMKNHEPRYLERLQALKYLAAKKSRVQIGKLLDRRQETILHWIHLWNTGALLY